MNPTLQKTFLFSAVLPDRVNRASARGLDASGKGINVTRVLTQLGRDCVHLTQLGGAFRPAFLELCAADGLRVEWVESRGPIRFCCTVLEGAPGARRVTELVEEGERVGPDTEADLLGAFERLLPGRDVVIVSGTRAAGFSGDLVPGLTRRAKAAGCRVILDLRGEDLLRSLPAGPDLIKPNLYEFLTTFAPDLVAGNEAAGDPVETRERTAAICRRLWEEHGCAAVLTRGSSAVWFTEAGRLEEWPVAPVEVVNTIGSGDAFTAGLAAALADGAGPREAVAEGARCGALNAGLLRPGVIRE